jgi:hypothetical protein
MLESALRLLLLLVIAASWVLGGMAFLPRRVKSGDPFLVVTSALGLAAGTTALAVAALGAFGLLRRGPLLAIQAAWTIAGLLNWRNTTRLRALVPPRWWRSPVTLALAATLSLTLLSTLAPPTSMDATVYHLRVPREFLRAQRVVPLFDDVHSFQPLNVEMLFTLGMSIDGAILAALVHWLLGLGAALSAAAWTRRLRLGSGSVACAVFAVSPLFVWESTSAFIDLGLALFSSLALLWASEPEPSVGSRSLTAIFAGFAMGSKFTGCAAVLLSTVLVFGLALPDLKRALRRAVPVGVAAIAIGAPWYVRNALFTGNPFYPVANRLFGVSDPPVALSNWTYGFGRDLLHLLTSPFDLVWRGAAFDSGWAVGPAYLALVPVVLVMFRRATAYRLLGVALAIHWLLWFFSSPQTRLLLPIMPMAAGMAGTAFSVLSRERWTAWSARAVVATALAAGLGAAALVARGSWRVAAGIEAREAFLRRMAWDYPAYEEINRRVGPNAKLAVLGATNLYYLEPPATIVYPPDLPSLTERGFTHFVHVSRCGEPPPATPGDVIWRMRYQLPGSRFQGIPGGQEMCAELATLR